DYKKTQITSLTGLEHLTFENPYVGSKFEAFVTGGGSSNLPTLLQGKVRNLDYKTIRYPGHFNVMKSLELLGLFHEGRELMTQLFETYLMGKDFNDIVVARAYA